MSTLVHCCGAGCGITAIGPAVGSSGFGGRRHWFRSTTGVVPTIVASARYPGAKAYRWSAAGATGYLGQDFPVVGTIAVLRASVMFTQLPSADCDLLILSTTSGAFPGVRYSSATGKLNASFGTTVASGVVVELHHWYVVDVTVNCGVQPWLLNSQIDGVVQTQVTKNQAPSTLIGYRQGIQSAVTAIVDLSDFAVSLTAGDYPLGNGRVIGLYPSYDGTHAFVGANPGPDDADPFFATSDFYYNDNRGYSADGSTFLGGATPVLPAAADVHTYWDDVAGADGDYIGQDILNEQSYLEVGFPALGGFYPVRGIEVVSIHRSTGAIKQRTVAGVTSTYRDSDSGSNAQSLKLVDGNNPSWQTTVLEDLDQSQGAASQIVNGRHIALHPSGRPWTLAQFAAIRARYGFGVDVDSVPDLDTLCLEVATPLPPVVAQYALTVNAVVDSVGVRGEGVVASDTVTPTGGTIIPPEATEAVIGAEYPYRAEYDWPSTVEGLRGAELVDPNLTLAAFFGGSSEGIVTITAQDLIDQARIRHWAFTDLALGDGAALLWLNQRQLHLLLRYREQLAGLINTTFQQAGVIAGVLVGLSLARTPLYLATFEDGYAVHLSALGTPYMDPTEAPIAFDPLGARGGTAAGWPLPTDLLTLLGAWAVFQDGSQAAVDIVPEKARDAGAPGHNLTCYLSGSRLVPIRPVGSLFTGDSWGTVTALNLSYVPIPSFAALTSPSKLPKPLVEPLVAGLANLFAGQSPKCPAPDKVRFATAAAIAEAEIDLTGYDLLGDAENTSVIYEG